MAVDKKWLAARLADAGVSQRKMAANLAMHPSALNKSINGSREFTPQEIADIADQLGRPHDEVARHLGVDVPRDVQTMVPVVGRAAASGAVTEGPGQGPRRTDRPSKTSSATAALRMADTGWLAYYDPSTRLEPEAVGALSVVTTRAGDVWLRILRKGAERGRWNLEPFPSSGGKNLEGVEVESAAPVTWIRVL